MYSTGDSSPHLLPPLHLLHVAGADLHRAGEHVLRHHRRRVREPVVREVAEHQVLQQERVRPLDTATVAQARSSLLNSSHRKHTVKRCYTCKGEAATLWQPQHEGFQGRPCKLTEVADCQVQEGS